MSEPAITNTMKINHQGFTLIELMIVVAIVAILAAIAYPSYTAYALRSNRAEAKAALLENMQFLERNFTVSNKYNMDSAGNTIDDASLPAQQTPQTGAAKFTFSVTSATPLSPTATTYTLTATPAGSMAADACGAFTIDQAGTKGLSGSPTLGIAECWGK